MVKVSPTASRRLKADYLHIKRDPVPFILAEPLPSNILEWHYVVEGPEDCPYHGGFYHGKLKFPPNFPFSPPSIYMITPSGRFKTDSKLCLSMSDFHPDTWNPAWTVSTILTGLLSFMLEDTNTHGSITSTYEEKKALASDSWKFNLKDKIFRELFPDTAKLLKKKIASAAPKAEGTTTSTPSEAASTTTSPPSEAASTTTSSPSEAASTKTSPPSEAASTTTSPPSEAAGTTTSPPSEAAGTTTSPPSEAGKSASKSDTVTQTRADRKRTHRKNKNSRKPAH